MHSVLDLRAERLDMLKSVNTSEDDTSEAPMISCTLACCTPALNKYIP